MKISKLLMPTLSAIAVPAIAITSCSQQRTTEQDILDAIFTPVDEQQKPIDDFKTELSKLNQDEWNKDLIYGTFGMLNQNIGYSGKTINIRQLYKDNEGAFKINITKCNVCMNENEFYGTLLGYVSYVFEKEHKINITSSTEITFKANDFIMLTFDIVNAQMVINNTDFSFTWTPKLSETDVGLIKFKYDEGKEEAIKSIPSFSTATFSVKNSRNWVPKQ